MPLCVLITGATAGIGASTAHRCAKEGHRLILTGRREERLSTLKTELENRYQAEVHTLTFDIQNRQATETAVASLPKEWKKIDVLINNAGLALGTHPIHEGDPTDWDTMIDTNLKGLLYISRAVLPGMVQRQRGHIVNLSSIAGKEVYPGGNVYCATKHAVDALTKAMRIDLLPHNIRVSGVYPGKVETEFSVVRFHGDTERARTEYIGYDALAAEDIADAIVYAITRPEHVNVNEIIVMPSAQANTSHLQRKES